MRDEITTGAEQYPFLTNATAALSDTIPVVMLDDASRERAVRFTGSIGILIELVETGELDERSADRFLKRLIDETDYRAPSRELSEYL